MSEDPFEAAPVSRRQFVRLAAATGGALALPGQATADVSGAAFDAEYRYVLNHTPEEYEVPTLVEVSDAASLSTVETIAGDVRTTTEPRPAAHARLTTTQAERVADLPTAETLHFSPGANPFWRLGYYPLGVFPEPEQSVDYLDYEEVAAGFDHLADEHGDRMRVFSIGRSAGKYNYLSDRRDPRDVLVVEVAEDVHDREAFAEKRQVLVNCTIHGDERAGGEAATRFVEGLLETPDRVLGPDRDDVALIFTFTNPDGWAARRPQYDSYGAPGAPLHERGNAGGDTNRQFPNPGWVSAGHTIAEPLGATLDGESRPPSYVEETVPDTLAFVAHCRSYENLVCGIDLHGMLSSKDFVLALDGASQSSTDDLHESFELIEAIGARVTDNVQEWEALGDALSPVTDEFNPSVFTLSFVPEQAYNYGTPVETIGYSGTGFVDEWMAFPEELGGLGVPSLTMEMAYSNVVGGNVFDPVRVGMQVDGYRGAIRGAVDFATRAVEGRFEGSGDLAYVTTDELTSRATDLPHVDDEDDAVSYDPSGDSSTTELSLAARGGGAATHGVDEDVGALSVHPHVHESVASARLVAPDGDVVREYEATEGRVLGGICCGLPTWQVADPAPGEWTLELENALSTPSEAEARFVTTRGAGEAPDPREEIGYAQRDYEVTPLRYFEDLDADADVAVDGYDPADLNRGRLRQYDHLAVVHDDAGRKPDRYLEAVERFVRDGGNLVLTDSGLGLLAELGGTGISAGDVTEQTGYVGQLDEVFDDHPLVTDRRPIQNHLWYIAPLGYAEDEAPIYGVDRDAFEAAGGTVAGTTGGDVIVGTLPLGDGEVQVVGSLLPPAWQGNLHPFGMCDYAATHFGHLVMTNALYGQQVRSVDGTETKRIGRGRADE